MSLPSNTTSMPTITTAALLLLAAASLSNAQPNVTSNCVSGRITFDPLRTFLNYHPGTPLAPLDVSRYDAIVDYGASHVKFLEPRGVELQLVKKADASAADGIRVSLARYVLYARITARFASIPVPGAVTAFITMSDRHDEIDWEIVGKSTTTAQTNVFYKGIPEFGIHGTTEDVGAGGTGAMHDLSWGIDSKIVRTLQRETSVSPLTPPGERWFPSTASLIQFSRGTRNWAGGPIAWGSNTTLSTQFEYIEIQCYNDKDEPVAKWPADAANPDRRDALPTQPTSNAQSASDKGTQVSGDAARAGFGSGASNTTTTGGFDSSQKSGASMGGAMPSTFISLVIAILASMLMG
ncbi:concanavalin A-like lectin/glucanase domain-containing protein [Entophlyctis helioformis]|nr:concanavalin A-like lectin/glucanase domain-containing protein [Entophlyctis helioformis]